MGRDAEAEPADDPAPPARAVQVACLALSIAGLLVSGYLTYAHFTSSRIVACSGSGLVNCEAVTTSAQSKLLGIPVALLGLAYFVAMVALNLPAAWRLPSPRVRFVRLVLASAGMAFVLWLLYAELFVIGSICLWCTVVHVITFALFVVLVLNASAQRA